MDAHLVNDVCNLIMLAADALSPECALMLACTCNTERQRYSRLFANELADGYNYYKPDITKCDAEKRRYFTYRRIYVHQCLGEEWYDASHGQPGVVFRGERGFDKAQRYNDKRFYKMKRKSWDRPLFRAKRALARKERQLREHAWRKGDY